MIIELSEAAGMLKGERFSVFPEMRYADKREKSRFEIDEESRV